MKINLSYQIYMVLYEQQLLVTTQSLGDLEGKLRKNRQLQISKSSNRQHPKNRETLQQEIKTLDEQKRDLEKQQTMLEEKLSEGNLLTVFEERRCGILNTLCTIYL